MRKDAGGLQVRHFDLRSFKMVDATAGAFSGYATRWGEVDVYGETLERGAFLESLARTADKGRKLPILWQHRTADPIGVWNVLREDDRGLYAEGSLWIDDAPNARIAMLGMKAGCITGLSIGYFVEDDSFDEVRRVRVLKRVDLREISVVTDPALEEARVETFKRRPAPDLREMSDLAKALRSLSLPTF